ncbi:MAG: hypothetical protein NC421_11675 [Lachnospiraceae bacterium]|nr:hypothetical protein [Lachnospiraceae bacterium]
MRGLLYIIMMLVIAGCSYSNSQSLKRIDEAQSLMLSDPKAALDKLNAIDVAALGDSALVARWALLYSEAMVANKISAPTDTIVDMAIDYYSRHDFAAELRHASALKALLKKGGNADELASALYLQKEKEFMLYRERVKHERYLYAGIFLLLLAMGVILWQHNKMKLKDARNAALFAEAAGLRADISGHLSGLNRLELWLSDILAVHFNVIDELCQTYYESQGTKIERKAIVDKVKEQIAALKADENVFAKMELCVDRCRKGLLSHLKEEYPSIKPDEYRMMVYLASNLSSRSIALLIGESIDVVYKRKSRLKSKLSSLELPHSELFLSIF